jgi:hypothetical protein
MVEFVEASVLELIKMTEFIHTIRPSTKNKFVYGLKKPADTDRSIVFYLMPRQNKDGVEATEADVETVILSADYIVEHPFWNEEKNNG